MRTTLNVTFLLLAAAGTLSAQITNVIFSDDFETGTMAKWTTTAGSPLDPSTVTNIVPPFPTGHFSAYMNTSIDRMHHNLIADNGGSEVAGRAVARWWIYDPGAAAPATRIFCEVRGYLSGTGLPNGGTVANGSLLQLLAAGKYNSVTLPGEVFNGTKYQARANFLSNTASIVWFNLNAAGSPNRSTGWHRFEIERMSDGTTMNFYVDGVLSRAVTGAVPEAWDTMILGPGLGSTVGDAWIDGMSISTIQPDTQPPILNCPTGMTVIATAPFGAVVNYTVTATDNSGTNLTIVCNPPSGSTLFFGLTLVNCTACDPSGNCVNCSFPVTVELDLQPPTLACPAAITVSATTPSGAVVTYAPTATDNSGTNLTITCNPPSGSTFPIGTTPLNCSACDPSGNCASCSSSVTVQALQPPPTITDFAPHEGGEGTILTINGTGFHGGTPDDHCAVLMAPGNRFIDIEVLTATPTQLVARVGVIPPSYQGQPLQLMVATGQGTRGVICPLFHDVTVAPDNWIWRGDAADGVTAPATFFTLPSTQPSNTAMVNFHSGAPSAGMLTVTLNKDWGIGSRYCISARVHAQGTGADTRISSVTFTGNGSRFDCAARICDLLVKAFASHPQRPLTILCSVLTNGANAVIKITLPSGVSIDGGNIDIIQKAPPPVIVGLWDIQNAGIWRKEIRKHELARWYRCFEWRTLDTIWFERRAEGLWITKQALETFTCRSHCIYRFSDGRVWLIWRTFSRADIVRFWVHYRFWWPGRLNPLLSATNTLANRTMMSMDDLQIVLPMTPVDPNPSTPFNEAVMIVDENGVQHFQGQPGFEIPPDIAENPNGFQIATTAESTAQLPAAADRIRDIPMTPMPGMASLQPGVIIQWLVDKNGNVLVDHDQDGWPDPITSPYVLGGQKHQGLIAPPTGVAGNALSVDQGNNQLQLFCWELDPTGEVRGASPGQVVIGPPGDLNGDGVADSPIGSPVPADPTVRQLVFTGSDIQEQRDPTAKPFDLAVVEEAAPTDAQLAAMNANLGAQIPGFVPLQRPFVLCINRIWVRQLWTIDRRYVFDTWFHHWVWQHRNHIVLTHQACRVWLTKVSLDSFSYAQHCFPFGQPPTWRMASLTDLRFLRVCFRVIVVGPNQVVVKLDQMHVVLPTDPNNPNSPLGLLSTRGDENALFQEVPAAVLAGLQPDPLPVGPDGVFIEPIDPVAGTLDIGAGGTGVFASRPMEARGMSPVTLGGNADDATAPSNNQLQLFCWALNPNGTLAQETFLPTGSGQPITLAMTPTPALPTFVDDAGNTMGNPTMFITTLTSADNTVNPVRNGDGTMTITWDGPGQLQSAELLVGNGPGTTWADVAGGSLSGVTVPRNQPKRFYRLRR